MLSIPQDGAWFESLQENQCGSEPALPWRLPAHPGMKPPMPTRLVRELADDELPAELVDDADGERALVRVDPNEHHLDLRSDSQYDRVERRARMRGASQAPIKRRRSPR
ncbi:MAG: hypothetical protein DCC49_10765 [Acidobacteria bacterium]|nr:MAG: hypothetical protein DCC49_10765 [Acidobacteriota bacterium]